MKLYLERISCWYAGNGCAYVKGICAYTFSYKHSRPNMRTPTDKLTLLVLRTPSQLRGKLRFKILGKN